MIRSWKALSLLAAVTLGLGLVFLSPAPSGVTPAFAAGGTVNVNIIDTDNPNGGTNIDFTVAGTATCGPGTFSTSEGAGQALTCSANGGVTITLQVGEPWTVDFSTSCSVTANGTTGGAQSTGFSNGATVISITTLTDDETITCSVRLTGTGGITPTATGTPPTATPTSTPGTATPTITTTPSVTTLTVSIAPSTLGCNGSAFVTVVSRNAAGALVPGGTVTLSTNLGTISPTTATDTGGGVLAVLTAPATQGGTATIVATAGGVTGQAQATINCNQATSTSVPATSVPPVATISPPRTGDAGLARGSNLSTTAGLALLGIAFAGAAGMVWSKVRN